MTRRKKDEIRRQKMFQGMAFSKTCTSKKGYNSDLEALAYGRVANDYYNNNVLYDTYFCHHCSKWHLTTKKG